MKAKTIKSICASRIESLAAYVENYTIGTPDKPGEYPDAELAGMIRKGTILTGGAIVSMLLQQKPNDYDMYFRTRELAMRVAKFFLWLFQKQSQSPLNIFIAYQGKDENGEETGAFGLFGWGRHAPTVDNWEQCPGEGRFKIVIKSAGIAASDSTEGYQYFEAVADEEGESWVEAVTKIDDVGAEQIDNEKETEAKGKHHPKFMSSNAISLAGKLQLITRFYGEPEEIHANYDFIHCTCYYRSWDKELVLPAAALEAILAKELRYVGSLYPVCSIIRIRKFVSRGWTINAGQILKMCMQVSQLDLNNLETLEDQLVGVDAAYFMQIIQRLRAKQDEEIQAIMAGEGISESEARLKVDKIDSSYLMTIIDRIF